MSAKTSRVSCTDLPSLRDAAKLLGGDVSGGQILCPGPDHSKRDRSLSVRFDPEAPDGFVVHSFACQDPLVCRDYVRERLGLGRWTPRGSSRRLVATYNYTDEVGRLVIQVRRYEPKSFSQRRKARHDDPPNKIRNGWINSVKGERIVPYRLPELLEAISSGHPVLVVEGEKDCNTLCDLAVVATCNAGGAGKWTAEHAAFLKGADVVLIADDDGPGRAHMQSVGASLQGIAARVRQLDLPAKDVTLWIEGGGTTEQLWSLIQAAPDWSPREAETEPEPNAWNDPDWSLLDTRRGELPNFPSGVMSPAWQHWLDRASRGAGVSPEHVIVPLLSIASSLIGTARRVRASRSWSEPLSLWTAVVGFSGTGKTPGLEVSRRALSRIERSRKGSAEELRLAHEQKVTAAKAALKKWKAEVQEAIDKGQKPPIKPAAADDPGPFVAPRFCVTDVTIERLAVLIEARKRGMLVVVDELAGLFINMSRYTNGSDREFWLQAWNGGHHVVERLGRPPVVIEHLLVGVTGGFQPDKLVRSFKGDDDGMYARVLFGWPCEPGYEPLSNAVTEIEPQFQEALMRLIDLPVENGPDFVPRYLGLSGDALREFEKFRQFLHAGKQSLDGREREWWAKGATHVLRLAATLTYLDWAMPGEVALAGDATNQFEKMLRGAAEPTEVDAAIMAAAIRLWKEYFWLHARACLRQVGLSHRHKFARRVLEWLRAQGRSTVSREDIRRDALGQQLDAEATDDLLNALAKAGWLKQERLERNGPGRPANRWSINPQLFLKEIA